MALAIEVAATAAELHGDAARQQPNLPMNELEVR